jgi:hypothetical protein
MLEGEPRKVNDLELLARLTSLAWLSVAQQKRQKQTDRRWLVRAIREPLASSGSTQAVRKGPL